MEIMVTDAVGVMRKEENAQKVVGVVLIVVISMRNIQILQNAVR